MKTPPPPPESRNPSGFSADSLLLLAGVFAVFLLFRPYQGIIHDARLYVGYAMAALDPEGIGRDIVFVNDGQSKFSVYPMVMRALAGSIGPSKAAMVLTYGGLTLWFAAFALLVRRMLDSRFSDRQVLAIMLLAVSLPSGYGGQGVFRFAEHFATPRAFAEAAVMVGFTALLGRRTVVAFAALAVSALFHPLMAAPGFGVLVWYGAESRRAKNSLIGVAVIGTCVLLAATLMLDTASKPFARFDSEWMAALNTKHAIVFLRTWRVGDAIRILLHVVTVGLALPRIGHAAQRLVQSVLIVVAAGVALSILGGDIAENVLVTQGQAWRGLWLLAALATVLLGVLLQQVWATGSSNGVSDAERNLQKAASMFLVIAWIMVDINSTTFVFALLAVMFWFLPNIRPWLTLSRGGVRVVGALTCLLLVSVVVVQTWVTMTTAWSSPDSTMRWALNSVIATGVPALLVLAVFARALVTSSTVSRGASVGAIAITAGLLVLVLFAVDSRTRYQHYVESELDARAKGVPAPIAVPRGSTVLWPYADIEPWAFAGAPGWGTIVQGMPSVFDRALAIRWSKRAHRLKVAGLLPLGQTGAETMAVLNHSLSRSILSSLCKLTDDPALIAFPTLSNSDFVVSRSVTLQTPRLLFPIAIEEPWTAVKMMSFTSC